VVWSLHSSGGMCKEGPQVLTSLLHQISLFLVIFGLFGLNFKCIWFLTVVRVSNGLEDLFTYALENNTWTSLHFFCREVVPIVATSKMDLPIDQKRLSVSRLFTILIIDT